MVDLLSNGASTVEAISGRPAALMERASSLTPILPDLARTYARSKGDSWALLVRLIAT